MATTVTAAAVLSPEQVSALVVIPYIETSVAMRASTVVQTGSHQLRVPRVTQDPAAAWVAEGAEIPVTDPTLDELAWLDRAKPDLAWLDRAKPDFRVKLVFLVRCGLLWGETCCTGEVFESCVVGAGGLAKWG